MWDVRLKDFFRFLYVSSPYNQFRFINKVSVGPCDYHCVRHHHMSHQAIDIAAVPKNLRPAPPMQPDSLRHHSCTHVDHFYFLPHKYGIWDSHMHTPQEDLESVDEDGALFQRQRQLLSFRHLQRRIRLCDPDCSYDTNLQIADATQEKIHDDSLVCNGPLVSHLYTPGDGTLYHSENLVLSAFGTMND